MLISTKTSLYRTVGDGPPEQVLSGLDIRRVQEGTTGDVAALADGSVLALKDGEQIKIDTGIADRIDSVLIIRENPLEILVGCTPPNLYRVIDGEAKLVPAFQSLADRENWYTPWGGPPAVRSMDITKDGWVYADIHVGSIMRSPDWGVNWEPVVPELHKDVHQVTTSPSNPDNVYANTYLSVYVSDDRGKSWSHRTDNLNRRYGRGIAVHPTEPDVLLCGVSDGPSGANVHGQLYWTENAGINWIHINDGFPDSTRKNIDTFHIKYIGDHAWVSDENKLYRSEDKGRSFELFWEAPEEITVLSASASP